MIDNFQITTEKLYSAIDPDPIQRTVIVWTQRFLVHKIEEVIEKMVKETVRVAIIENPEIREQIKKAVENAITTLPIAVLEESVRSIIKQELSEMRPKEEVEAPAGVKPASIA